MTIITIPAVFPDGETYGGEEVRVEVVTGTQRPAFDGDRHIMGVSSHRMPTDGETDLEMDLLPQPAGSVTRVSVEEYVWWITVPASGTYVISDEAITAEGLPVPVPPIYAATIEVGDVVQGEVGELPTVTNVGTDREAVLDFVLPPSIDLGVVGVGPNPGQIMAGDRARWLDLRDYADIDALVDDLNDSPPKSIGYVGSGLLNIASSLGLNDGVAKILGDGPDQTVLKASGGLTGEVVTLHQTPASATMGLGGLEGLTLRGNGDYTGTGTGGGVANQGGLRILDTSALKLEDIQIEGFSGTGNYGIKVENVDRWSERLKFDGVTLMYNTVGLDFYGDASEFSFAYFRGNDLRINGYAGQIGLRATEAWVYGADINILGNIVSDIGTGVFTMFMMEDGGHLDTGRMLVTCEEHGGAATAVLAHTKAGGSLTGNDTRVWAFNGEGGRWDNVVDDNTSNPHGIAMRPGVLGFDQVSGSGTVTLDPSVSDTIIVTPTVGGITTLAIPPGRIPKSKVRVEVRQGSTAYSYVWPTGIRDCSVSYTGGLAPDVRMGANQQAWVELEWDGFNWHESDRSAPIAQDGPEMRLNVSGALTLNPDTHRECVIVPDAAITSMTMPAGRRHGQLYFIHVQQPGPTPFAYEWPTANPGGGAPLVVYAQFPTKPPAIAQAFTTKSLWLRWDANNNWWHEIFRSTSHGRTYTTASRPTAAELGAGNYYWDQTLGRPVWSNGITFVDLLANLTNVDNTSDASKPVSTATQTALDLKGVKSSRFVGPPIDAYTSTAVVQTANLVYYYEVDAIDTALSLSTAWTEYTAVAAANWAAGIYRVDTGAQVAVTAPTAVPGSAGIASAALTGGPVTIPAGVGLVVAMGASVGAGITWRGLGSSVFYGSGAPRFGAQVSAASLALPSTLPAATALARRPVVFFT